MFFVLQIVLPARRVTGYVKDRETGEPRNYRLNGLLVFVIAHMVWAFEIGGLPRDWFYRSSLWAVVGGTVFCLIFAVWSVFTQPKGEIQNPWLALWEGRSQELQLFNNRIDIKMWWYVVGGTMLSLNALSGAAWHHNNVDDTNPGIYLYAAFWTFYTFDYFIWERVQLYTYDLIHEHIGFKLWWGGLVAYGWLFILPLWGMAPHSGPRVLDRVDVLLAHRGVRAVPGRLDHRTGRQPPEVHVQAVAGPQVPLGRAESTSRPASARS